MSIFTDKIILVTGASRNIGYHCAKKLAAQGAQIIATARTIGGLEKLDDEICANNGKKPVLVPFDLNDFDKIDALGASLFQRFGKLDGLIMNAGILGGTLTPVAHIQPEKWQETLNVNLTANYRLLRSLELLLKQSEKSAVLAVVDDKPHPFWAQYQVSKAGLIALMECYSQEMKKSTINIGTFCPSATSSKLRKTAFPGEDTAQLQTPEQTADKIIKHFEGLFSS
ncbi:MAG: SDR family NAD(P)-dependent oxidoreductase [Alphaproteobacteria bacterium]|nr:SDR family NAD(P)-dependent oxidoreductase [Alphaproteobacteria bacterium]